MSDFHFLKTVFLIAYFLYIFAIFDLTENGEN